jgi:hypothetical protein
MREPGRPLQLGDHIDGHEPITMLVIVRIVAAKRRLRFAGDLTGRLDAHILDQSLTMLFQITGNTHIKTFAVQIWTGSGEFGTSFPINGLVMVCHE